MEINKENLLERLSEALTILEVLGKQTQELNIFEGYFDFTFRRKHYAIDVYQHFSFIYGFSCDYDESRNRYLVRVFY